MSNMFAGRGCTEREEPIACTLDGREQHLARAAEFRDVFAHLERTEALNGAFRWYFRAELNLESRLRDLARREHECCRFFDFRITSEGNSVVWETRAPNAAASVLKEFMRLPATLSTTTSDAMARMLGAAGLTFRSGAEDPPAQLEIDSQVVPFRSR